MRCLAYCTAGAYQLDRLSHFFQSQDCKKQSFRNVLHIQNAEKGEDIFFFQHGCFVGWNLSLTKEKWLLSQIESFAVDLLPKSECHSFVCETGAKTSVVTDPEGNTDIVTLELAESNNILLKLAISYAFAQSVKLRFHEISIQKIVEKNQPISQELAERGHISLSRKAIFKRIGEIFLAKSSVNLSNEYLDVSEYFWRYPHLESHYLLIEKFLDIQKRVAILNQRLDVVHDVVTMLNNQLEHRHSSTLEIIIILLIFSELIINICSQYFKS